MDLLAHTDTWISLLTLTLLEVVLGIDNIVFISIVVGKLPRDRQDTARRIGLVLALVFRIVLLMFISAIIALKEPIITLAGHALSWKDIILIGGGLFLIYKAVAHLHDEVEGEPEDAPKAARGFGAAIGQIIVIDIVFSLDSIITAVGLVDHVEIMIAAVVIAVAIMLVASGPVARFINAHPTTKILALAFLLMVGLVLIADGWGFHVPRGYIYTAMAFAVGVEALNIAIRRKASKRGGHH